MTQEYVISNAFPAKTRDGQEKIWDSQHGRFKVWNLFFEGDEKMYQTNKKIDFQGFNKGDTVYGTLGVNKFGGGTFKSEQRPAEFNNRQSAPAKSQDVMQKIEALEKRVAYLEGVIDNSQNFKSGNTGTATVDEAGPAGDGVDLSSIPY